MKVFYRRDLYSNKIKEVVFCPTRVHDKGNVLIELSLYKSTTRSYSRPVEILRKTYTAAEYYTMFNILRQRLLDNGWKETFEEVIANKFNTYADKKLMSSNLKFIDEFTCLEDLVNITLPMSIFAKPNGYETTFYDGKFRNLKQAPTKLLLARAKYTLEVLRVPFNCFVNGDELIVYDAMITDSPYSKRLNCLTELNGTIPYVQPYSYDTAEELFDAYNLLKAHSEVFIIHTEAVYIPGSTYMHSFIVSSAKNDEAIVLEVENEIALCVSLDFDLLFQMEVSSATKTTDIIKYKENETATIKV